MVYIRKQKTVTLIPILLYAANLGFTFAALFGWNNVTEWFFKEQSNPEFGLWVVQALLDLSIFLVSMIPSLNSKRKVYSDGRLYEPLDTTSSYGSIFFTKIRIFYILLILIVHVLNKLREYSRFPRFFHCNLPEIIVFSKKTFKN